MLCPRLRAVHPISAYPPGRAGWCARLAGWALVVAAAPALATVERPVDPWEQSRRELLRTEARALELGEGLERDPERAADLYCQAARLGDAESQFNLGWMYANGRGVERNDGVAAYFFHAAAEQGMAQATEMLARVGGPPNYTPDCMLARERAAPPPPAATGRTAAEQRVEAAIARARALLARRAAPPAAAPLAGPGASEVRSRGPRHIVDLVKKMAPEFGLHPQLVLSVVETESNFDTVAVSPANAKGLMQLIPDTAARFGVRNPYDPADNLRGGMAYLRWLLAYYQGDVMLAVAAYNAGEGAVNRYRGVPPYAETRAYVLKVLAGFEYASHPYDARVTGPSPLLASMRQAVR